MSAMTSFRTHALAFLTVGTTAVAAFFFVAAGALSTYRLLGVLFALPFGMLVGLAERASLDRAHRPRPPRYALLSGLGFAVWALVGGAVGGRLVFALAKLDHWGPLMLLAAVAGLAGAVASVLVEARAPPGLRFALWMLAGRVACVLAAAAVYRAGKLYWGVAAAAIVYALALTVAARPSRAGKVA